MNLSNALIALLTFLPGALSVHTENIKKEEPARLLRSGNAQALQNSRLLRADSSSGSGKSYIVRFSNSDGDPEEKAKGLAKGHSGSVNKVYKKALNGFSATLPPGKIKALLKEPSVASIEEDIEMYALGGTTINSWGQDRVDQCNGPVGVGGPFVRKDASGVKIYVADTGVYGSHDDFAADNLIDFSCSESFTNGQDQSTRDKNGHGTHVASTICGDKYGIVDCGAQMLCSIQVLSSSGSGSTSGIIAGIEYIMNDCGDGDDCVLNMSLGGGYSPAFNEAVTAAVDSGIVVVVAAGNSNADACNYSPASATGVISVGATDSNDNLASFTNFGNCVDIFGPGVGITAAWDGSSTATNTISGTSMASPHVAALAAAALRENPGSTPSQVLAELKDEVTMMDVDCNYPGTGISTVGSGDTLDCSGTSNTCGGSGPSPPTAPPPAPSPFELDGDSQPLPKTNLSGSTGNVQQYYFDVAKGSTVTCSLNGQDGDADLYVRFGGEAVPNSNSAENDCASYSSNSIESCTTQAHADETPTTVYVAIHAWASYTSLDVTCTENVGNCPVCGNEDECCSNTCTTKGNPMNRYCVV